MFVALIGKGNMYKITLPETTGGNYWICDNTQEEKKLVNIESVDGEWQITSNPYVQIINPKYVYVSNEGLKIQFGATVIEKTVLKEYSMLYLIFRDSPEIYVLYCAPTYESDFLHLDVKNVLSLSIGKDSRNDILYNIPLVKDKHAQITFNNGRWVIENFDNKFGTFVNDKPVLKEATILSNGDVIFIMGLKIILMGKSIYINNPFGKVIYNTEDLVPNNSQADFSHLKREDNTEVNLYMESDYFARAPRITNLIEPEKVKIDPPPAIQDKQETPLILTLGSTLTMGSMMMISVVRSIDGLVNGTATTKETIFTLITALLMLVGMLLIPIFSVKWDRSQKKKYEEKRQKRYKAYLSSKEAKIEKIKKKQRKILFENFVSAEECTQIILQRKSRLWERKIEEPDFLTVRIGIGDVPLKIDIQYPEESFAMEDDNLVDTLNEIGDKSKTLKDAPITISLVEKNISALVVQENEKLIEKFMQSIILQLITFHSYEDLKLVFLLDKDDEEKWGYVKTLPHIWNNTKDIRFYTDDYTEMKAISMYLENELQNRAQYASDADYRSFMPYYLIITDDYKKIESLKIITQILKCRINMGFSILCIGDNLMQLPNECKTFITLNNQEGAIFESEMSSTNKKQFTFDTSVNFFFEKISYLLANIPIRYSVSNSVMMLPTSYTFLQMYGVGRIEQLNILERWKNNDATRSLQAPVGVDSSGMPIFLDIHEKFHGPHGLIAGSTGSGKSEFIITYILSLAINFHPDDVAFILIDYKGGGLAGAFKKENIKLPHLVGTITNIDTVGLQRSLASIQSELKRRQVIFYEARNKIEGGTIDIYKYQKLYHQGIVKEAVPHLLIICDEFAELKQQQEEFMDELISVARIGRSLGVHLILATQKPAGIVNDQIRSNSKFGVCLKVQEREDSMDVIKKPDAAYLKQTGQFYLQVGNDEYFVLGQAAWAGAPYFPYDLIKKKVDNSIKFISSIGIVIKEVGNTVEKQQKSKGEQLTSIVKYIDELAKENDIKSRQLWLDNVPDKVYIKELRKKYHAKSSENKIVPVIGEYDDPSNQRQGIASLNFSEGGNVVVYGNAESGKETLLSTIIYDIMTTHSTQEVQFYIMDFGSESLKIFKQSPHVGDVVFMNDEEKISRLFTMIQTEIKSRTQKLSDYGGDYKLYIKTSGNIMPMMVIIINNYEAFNENYEIEYDDLIQTLTRDGLKCGILFIITVSTAHDVRYRMAQNFRQKVVLQLNSDDDYVTILDKAGKKRPSRIFGRGLIELNDVYEFQTARISEPEEWNTVIKQTIEELKETNPLHAKHIPTLPDVVTFEDVKEDFQDLSTVPLGISKKKINTYTYDFKNNYITMMTAKNIEAVAQYITHVLEEIKMLEDVDVTVLDSERVLSTKRVNINEKYKKFLKDFDKNLETDKYSLCIIIGIDKFLNDLEDGEQEFLRMLEEVEETESCSFVIVDNFSKLKSREYDEWYKNYIANDGGIWVGKGISDQYLISVNQNEKNIENYCPDSFGYVIKKGVPTYIKLLGMKGNDEEDE